MVDSFPIMRRVWAWTAAILIAPLVSWAGTMVFLIGLSLYEDIVLKGARSPSQLWVNWVGVWTEWIGGWTGLMAGLGYFFLYTTPVCLASALVFGFPAVRILEHFNKTGWGQFVATGIVVGILTAFALAIGITWEGNRSFVRFMGDNDAEGLFLLSAICGGGSGWLFWRIAIRVDQGSE